VGGRRARRGHRRAETGGRIIFDLARRDAQQKLIAHRGQFLLPWQFPRSFVFITAGIACALQVAGDAMHFKIHGSTAHDGDATLCSTCTHSTIIRGQARNEEIITCNRSIRSSMRITFRVTSCSDYNDARLPSMYELTEKAWILRRGSKRRAAGFIHGRDLKIEELSEAVSECDAGFVDEDHDL
jgi:hypothetical protein